MSGGTSQQFCVRWNSHLGSLGAAFPQLLAGQRFVDVTLACEGHQVHCHRLVLAACSTYFESLLGENPCKHPIIILPRDIKLWEIQALVDFMYKGEVNVSQAGLPDLLKCAETLQIRGLCGSDAALNLNHITNNSGSCNSNSNSSSSTTTTTSSSGGGGHIMAALTAAAGTASSILASASPSTNSLVTPMPNSSSNSCSNSCGHGSAATSAATTLASSLSSTTTTAAGSSYQSSTRGGTMVATLSSNVGGCSGASVSANETTTATTTTTTNMAGIKLIIGAVASGGLDVTSATSQHHPAQVTNILRSELLNSFKMMPTASSSTTPSTQAGGDGVATAVITTMPLASNQMDDGEDSANGSSTELNIKSEEIDDMDMKMRHDFGYDLDGSGKLQEEKIVQQPSNHNRSHQRQSHNHHIHQQNLHNHHHQSQISTTLSPLIVAQRPHNQHDTVIVPVVTSSCISNTLSGGGGGGNIGTNTAIPAGTIRVKSNENLFDNHKRHQHHPPLPPPTPPLPPPAPASTAYATAITTTTVNNTTITDKHSTVLDSCEVYRRRNNSAIGQQISSSITMATQRIRNKRPRITHCHDNIYDGTEMLPPPPPSPPSLPLPPPPPPPPPPPSTSSSVIDGIPMVLPSSLRFNKKTMAIFVKNTPFSDTIVCESAAVAPPKRTRRPVTSIGGGSQLIDTHDVFAKHHHDHNAMDDTEPYENIICSPNFVQLPYMMMDDDTNGGDDDDNDNDDHHRTNDDEDIEEIDGLMDGCDNVNDECDNDDNNTAGNDNDDDDDDVDDEDDDNDLDDDDDDDDDDLDDAAAAAMAAAEDVVAVDDQYQLLTVSSGNGGGGGVGSGGTHDDDNNDDDDDNEDDIDMATMRNTILDDGSVCTTMPRLIPFGLMQGTVCNEGADSSIKLQSGVGSGGGGMVMSKVNSIARQQLGHLGATVMFSGGSNESYDSHQLYGSNHASHIGQLRFNMQMKLEADCGGGGDGNGSSISSGGGVGGGRTTTSAFSGGQLRLNLHKKLGTMVRNAATTVAADIGQGGTRCVDVASNVAALVNGNRPAPPPSAVVLRNPRGNQPRTYSTDELYAALMDVKSGESIYRASQMHKVPRKTLRNWMKRWDIKSAYPMPRQLKQAAENKKKNKINQTIQTLMSTQ